MCAPEDFIRASAARGLSKTATREALGLNNYQFNKMLAALPDVEWCLPHQSVDFKRAQEARRGQFTDAQRRALAAAAQANKGKHCYTVRGITGTLRELVARFKVAASVSTVRRRIASGITAERALFEPPVPPAQRKARPRSAWEAVDDAFEGQPAPQCM